MRTAARRTKPSLRGCVLQYWAPHEALGQRTPMAVWRQGDSGIFANTAVDMTLRLDGVVINKNLRKSTFVSTNALAPSLWNVKEL